MKILTTSSGLTRLPCNWSATDGSVAERNHKSPDTNRSKPRVCDNLLTTIIIVIEEQ